MHFPFYHPSVRIRKQEKKTLIRATSDKNECEKFQSKESEEHQMQEPKKDSK